MQIVRGGPRGGYRGVPASEAVHGLVNRARLIREDDYLARMKLILSSSPPLYIISVVNCMKSIGNNTRRGPSCDYYTSSERAGSIDRDTRGIR